VKALDWFSYNVHGIYFSVEVTPCVGCGVLSGMQRGSRTQIGRFEVDEQLGCTASRLHGRAVARSQHQIAGYAELYNVMLTLNAEVTTTR
jgi:hypothetical protein